MKALSVSPPLKVEEGGTAKEPLRARDTCPLKFWGVVANYCKKTKSTGKRV